MDGCIHNQTVHASILRRGSSACPTSDWMEAVAALTPAPDAPVYINVGANKGYSALEFLSLWTAHRVSGQRWKRVVFSYKGGGGSLKQRACGNCKDCQRPLPAPHDRRGGRAYLLEMTAGNRGLLRHVLNETGLAASATVHDVAASNASGVMRVPRTVVGDERLGLCLGADDRCSEVVRVVSVDDFMAEQGLAQAWLVSVDTEGHDPLVLEGASRALAARRVSLLQFEVSGRAYWSSSGARQYFRERRPLRRVLGQLEDWGYQCFWETTTAGLVPVTRACWRPEYERRTRDFWANVACAHEPRVLARMRDFVGVAPATTLVASAPAAKQGGRGGMKAKRAGRGRADAGF